MSSSSKSSKKTTGFSEAIQSHVRRTLGRRPEKASKAELYRAVALAIRDTLAERMLETEERYVEAQSKQLYYISIEFLIGRALASNLQSLDLYQECKDALEALGADLEEIRDEEPDAALGNGGLGRLAACFLDSLATLDLPGHGAGINYEYGLFRQRIRNGYQMEEPDSWNPSDSPWLLERPEEAILVPLYGKVHSEETRDGAYSPMWMDWQAVVGIPSDMPIVGHGGKTVNRLRLYTAKASREFDMNIFSEGDYIRALTEKISSETISKVLYPSDEVPEGKELRLIQEYFLSACAVRDAMRSFDASGRDITELPNAVALQLNDTHPALTVAELMRLLVDERDLPWDQAWEITGRTIAYTNHTLLPEALEKWSVDLLGKVLPRHLQVIFEINRRFLEAVSVQWPGDTERLERMSLVEEGDEKKVRMANLSIVGSHSVNGVSALHSELVKSQLVPDFHQMWPEKFNNKTNGITPRRWLLSANPELASLITERIGDGWVKDLDALRDLEPAREEQAFRDRFMEIKRNNKVQLSEHILARTGVPVDPDSCFDIHAKRIHEYKRQLLNVLHIAHQYLELVDEGIEPACPKTYVFAGKAAPGYWVAKQTIKLVHSVANVVNNDPRSRDWLRVAFCPDYRVSEAARILPAADLSEQISTAGMEASGTGNMKFALNGALTIGTLDGANIEIEEEVGEENIFIFGLRAHEVEAARRDGYDPAEIYHENERVRRVLDAISGTRFSSAEPGIFKWVHQSLVENGDYYMLLADFDSYAAAQREASQAYVHRDAWAHMAILNTCRVGKFSSDRTISEYASGIWGIEPVR